MATKHSVVEDRKQDVAHIEVPTIDGDGTMEKTTLEDIVYAKPSLSLLQTIKTYPAASFLCFIAAVSAISDGYQITMSGSIIALPGFVNQFGFPIGVNGAMKLVPDHVSLFGTMKTIATAVGAAMGTWPSDRWGRKPMILAIQIILATGTICEMFSTHWSHWVVARTIEGFGNGLNISITNVYIAELAPTNGRGALIALYAVWYTVGGLLCSVALYVVQALPPSMWRNAIYSSWAFTGVACLLWLLLPETPRYLCQKNDEEGTKKVLNRLFAGTEGFNLEAEYAMLVREVDSQRRQGEERASGSYRDLLRRPNLRRLIVSGLPYFWQITLGVPIVFSYSAYFFQLAGLQNPFLGTLGISLVQIVFSIFAAVWLLERIGRRIPLLVGGAICILSVVSIGGVLKSNNSGAIGTGLVVLACVWSASLASTNSPLVYTYVSETATATMRAKTSGVALFVVYCSQIAWMYATPIMLNSPVVGLANSAFIYAGAATLIAIPMYFCVPELKGRTFEEIDDLFERGVSARHFAKADTVVTLARRNRAAEQV